MSEQAGKKVCVTGASGYIASWLVKQLLLRGYSVNATVRDLNDPKKTGHLMALEGAKERLHLFKADLLEEGSFDSAVDGCEGVFHLASPVTADVKDPQAELLDPAVKGTLNVLSSCAKLPFLRRVVLTSSMSAVFLPGRPLTPEVVVDESWFSSAEFCMETKKYYALSKTLAEDAAWKFIKERGIDMVVINPAMVVGPLLQPRLNIGASIIAKLIKGAKTYPNLTLCWVHVKDVADAHILAYETPSATGRYILSERVAHLWDLVKLLHEMYPTMQLPNECEGGGPLTPLYQVSKERATSLGITYFIPLEFTLKDAVESLNYNGFASS